MIYTACYTSPLGKITLAAEEDALTGLWFDGQKYDKSLLKNRDSEKGELPMLAAAKRWLDLYFEGRDPGFVPEIRLTGSEFRKNVSLIMLEIPYGATTTYGEIARELARRTGREKISPQAVGGAVGHNPISLIVPCHRVIGADGGLTGYAGGIEIKRRLLAMESGIRAWQED